MKIKTLLTLVAIIISSNAVSKESKTDDVLELNNETVLLKLNDGSKVLVKTCDEYVTLRKAGKKIVGYPGRDPQELGEATRNLDECFMKAYATAKGWKDVSATTQPASIKDIVEHFPAELAMKTSRTSGTKAKTISDTATDWSMTDNGAYISKANRVGYFPFTTHNYVDKKGSVHLFLTLANFNNPEDVWDFTSYEVVSQNSPVWVVNKIDVNSPLK
ncbi:hypothetical protein [Rahnella perminowiae]|uniref:hypothetical protein n=1 Tax=Rahnella perminowiae TaxID=2816244 RepID=UPI00215BEA48|nr:hypothetical protein [Rahnella perminowiae]MCR8998534.1 hypothetical protein [Rahnella perminowiae]